MTDEEKKGRRREFRDITIVILCIIVLTALIAGSTGYGLRGESSDDVVSDDPVIMSVSIVLDADTGKLCWAVAGKPETTPQPTCFTLEVTPES